MDGSTLNLKTRRCAIYTRKSSEEGLDQEYNSLAAQRDACAAYVQSQAGEGWELLADHYDDGGISGATLERPDMQRLIADVEQDKIDIVVVYKVDRLTRSLADFARLVEIFDANSVSFVSVTQAFNTTNSMGRLTLNVLLSFAQFEREVTGERIRDKIAQSKQRGMWMGGTPPLGYDPKDRSLVINKAEARLVRRIYERYLELGNVRLLMLELNADGVRSKRWKTNKGTIRGGSKITKGALYHILKNRMYLGEINHKGNSWPGNHKPIIGVSLFDRVQDRLKDSARRNKESIKAKCKSLLTGLLFDDRGNRLIPGHTKKRGRRYRYYVNQALQKGQKEDAGHTLRLPAPDLEGLILRWLISVLRNQKRIFGWLTKWQLNIGTDKIEVVIQTAEERASMLESKSFLKQREFVASMIKRIRILPDRVEMTLFMERLLSDLGADVEEKEQLDRTVKLTCRATLKRCGWERKLVVKPSAQSPDPSHPNPQLIKAIARAHDWMAQIKSGKVKSLEELAEATRFTRRYIQQLLPLATLGPDVTTMILEGAQPPDWNLETLVKKQLPVDWQRQRETLGLESSDSAESIAA